MKKLVFGLGFLVLAYASFVYLDNKQIQLYNGDSVIAKEVYDKQVKFNEVNKLLAKADTYEKLVMAQIEVEFLDKASKDKLMPYVLMRKASILFNEGEVFLRRAEEIEFSLTLPEPKESTPYTIDPANPYATPPAPEPKKYHPLTLDMLGRATNCYEEARKLVDTLSDNSEADFNFEMNYLKGEIYYRFLEFLADADTAQELFNQTLSYYKMALRHKPGDINTVVNIELLIKNQSAFLANSNNPQVKRKQMLNVRKAGLGSSKGN